MMDTGAFPKHVKFSLRTAAWVESEIDAFMNARIAERDQEVHTPDVSPYLRMGEVMRLTGMTHAVIYDGVRAKTRGLRDQALVPQVGADQEWCHVKARLIH